MGKANFRTDGANAATARRVDKANFRTDGANEARRVGKAIACPPIRNEQSFGVPIDFMAD